MLEKRKSLIRISSIATGVALLPQAWVKPVINSVVLPAHAQTSAMRQISVSGSCSDISNVTAGDVITIQAMLELQGGQISELSWVLTKVGASSSSELASGTGAFPDFQYTITDTDVGQSFIFTLTVSAADAQTQSVDLCAPDIQCNGFSETRFELEVLNRPPVGTLIPGTCTGGLGIEFGETDARIFVRDDGTLTVQDIVFGSSPPTLQDVNGTYQLGTPFRVETLRLDGITIAGQTIDFLEVVIGVITLDDDCLPVISDLRAETTIVGDCEASTVQNAVATRM